jgi:hypothetical protein
MPYADSEELRHHRELQEKLFREQKAIRHMPKEIVYGPWGSGYGRSYLTGYGHYGDPRRRYTTNLWADFYRELDEGVPDIDDFIARYVARLKAGGRSAEWARSHVISRIKQHQEDSGYQYL